MVNLKKVLLAAVLLYPLTLQAKDVQFLVQPATVIGPISPYIYGVNESAPPEMNATVRRLGGNRTTGYNWETNASSAGADWHHFNDDWLCSGNYKYKDCDQPGAVYQHFVEENQALGLDSLLTIQMAGYVSGDKSGAVKEEEKAPGKRWVKTSPRKKGPYSLTPDLKDGTVYTDEFVNFLISKFKKASEGGVKFYSLDNEPALWTSTHPRIHPEKVGYRELVDKSGATAANILRLDPDAKIVGPAAYGWQEFLTLQDAPESKELNATYGTFLDFYLEQMRLLEKKGGNRLLHILDLHWYPEAQGGGKRITEGDKSPDSIEARVQAPRSLWDPGYVEKSWITQWSTGGKPLRLIPWAKDIITKRYPGTALAFTEYDYGAGDHVSGGLAQADVLGVFGDQGVTLANYWGALKPYNQAAFKLYRNYDGAKSTFGDTAVSAGCEEVAKASIHAAVDSKRAGLLWMVVLNKDQKETLQGKFQLEGMTSYKDFESFGFDGTSSDIRPLKKGGVSGNKFTLALPPLSATVIVCHQK
jgi:mannan endo-1,4-beta-mannosidase